MIWRCNRKVCTALQITSITFDFIECSVHNHCKDDFKYDRVLMSAKIKEKALKTNVSEINMIVSAVTGSQTAIFKIKQMMHMINRTMKRHNLTIDKNYDIPIELHKTSKNKKFLNFDS
ncbi:hypothetical protein DMUE_3099, partial [Dictyocoela muelleri]